jgi:hypothetical protein
VIRKLGEPIMTPDCLVTGPESLSPQLVENVWRVLYMGFHPKRSSDVCTVDFYKQSSVQAGRPTNRARQKQRGIPPHDL